MGRRAAWARWAAGPGMALLVGLVLAAGWPGAEVGRGQEEAPRLRLPVMMQRGIIPNEQLDGYDGKAVLVSENDGSYYGRAWSDCADPDSIANPSGPFGGREGATIWNDEIARADDGRAPVLLVPIYGYGFLAVGYVTDGPKEPRIYSASEFRRYYRAKGGCRG